MEVQAPSLRRDKNRTSWNGNVYEQDLIGQGGAAFVFGIDNFRVAKLPKGSAATRLALERERAVYRILSVAKSPSPHVIACFETEWPSGLVLERCVESVRDRVSRMRSENLTNSRDRREMENTVRWSYQASVGLEFIHAQGIIQADVGCHNMLLDEQDDLKISDFSGSVIERTGEAALVSYDVHSQLPNVRKPSRKTDLFALGSAMYEMATWNLPHHTLSAPQVRRRFENKQWPDMSQLRKRHPVFVRTIEGCWNQEFERAAHVAARMQKIYFPTLHSRHTPQIPNGSHHGSVKGTKISSQGQEYVHHQRCRHGAAQHTNTIPTKQKRKSRRAKSQHRRLPRAAQSIVSWMQRSMYIE